MDWIPLNTLEQLDEIAAQSKQEPVLIFKHSTRCSISDMAKGRLDRSNGFQAKSYYLDLIAHRDISNEIAVRFKVHHESPQIILLHQGACVFDESHNGIMTEEIEEQIAQLA